MADDSIIFSCHICGDLLSAPVDQAGVSGPCPNCQTLIQAPVPVLREATIFTKAPVGVAGGSVTTTGQTPPAATAVFQIPAPVLRPEPRQLPHRSNQVEPFAKQTPEAKYSGQTFQDSQPPTRHARPLLPLLLVIGTVILILGVTILLKHSPKPTASRIRANGSGAATILPEKRSPLKPPAVAPPSISKSALAFPPGQEEKPPEGAAEAVLNQFLTARTLAERLPLMETRTTEAELAASCVARPLPETRNILNQSIETDPVEKVTDIYYSVDFDAGNNRSNPQTILVRSRGTAKPKIVVDPFLDSFGGRLAAYATAPSEKGAFFQVIVWPLASCYEAGVPNREKKLTLKLLPRENAKEIALAHVGRQSKIAETLQDGTSSLRYGKAEACTVMLRWNTEEDPGMPYLEAIAIKTLDWNP